MKLLLQRSLLLIVTLLAYQLQAQVYNIATYNGHNITTCSGTFYDSGGPSGNYLVGETYVITFTPGTAGAYINIDFSNWAVAHGDNLEIFDGPNVSSPSYGVLNSTLSPVGLVIRASVLNPTGSLTLKWTSVGTSSGWVAAVSCGLPCQNYSVSLLSSTPPFHVDSGYYYIDICPGDSVSMTAQGIYPLNDSVYHQNDTTTHFEWDMGNYHMDSALTVGAVYDTIKGYNIEINAVDTNGCMATQTPKVRIRTSTKPSFDGTHQLKDELCQGDSTSLIGISTTKLWHGKSSLNHAGTTYLPDGSGASYTSTLIFNVFSPGQTITSVNDIIAVRATLEHSYLGDLNITITCPNGQLTTLKSFSSGGSNTFLGEPIDNNPQPIPGLGYEYAWETNGTTTMANAAGTYNHTFTDVLGTTYNNHPYLPPSFAYPAGSTALPPYPLVIYKPETPYTSLIGCPLNGTWQITITDNLLIDNGYIFAWGIDFAPAVLPVNWSYKPAISSETWNSSPSIIRASGNNITILPSDTGNHPFTFTMVDDFGCSYDTTLNVNVLPTPQINLGNDTIICGFGIVTLDAGNALAGTTYQWNTGNTTQIQQTNITGDYIATVSYSRGNLVCSNTDSVHVDQYDLADVNLGNDTCVGESIVLRAGNTNHYPPFIYNWSDGSTADTLLVTSPGKYYVTVAIDPSSPCTVEDSIIVSIFSPTILGADKEFCSFEDIGFNIPHDGTNLNHKYRWFLDGNLSSDTSSLYAQKYMPVGQHTLLIKIDNGCTDMIHLNSKDCQLKIPNVITPNGDGINDVFKISGLINFPNTQLIIFNRWGKKVFESFNYSNDWNASNDAEGVYYYILKTTVGQKKKYEGSLSVFRN